MERVRLSLAEADVDCSYELVVFKPPNTFGRAAMRTAVRRTVYVSWRKELAVSETLIPMTAAIGVT